MSKKNKKSFSSEALKMYKYHVDPTDLLSCYAGALNTMKHNSFNGHCNYIDIYNDTSIYDYAYNNYECIPIQDYIHEYE